MVALATVCFTALALSTSPSPAALRSAMLRLRGEMDERCDLALAPLEEVAALRKSRERHRTDCSCHSGRGGRHRAATAAAAAASRPGPARPALGGLAGRGRAAAAAAAAAALAA